MYVKFHGPTFFEIFFIADLAARYREIILESYSNIENITMLILTNFVFYSFPVDERDLIRSLLKKYPTAHFFIDEITSLDSSPDLTGKFL
jgi:hypothetical protein